MTIKYHGVYDSPEDPQGIIKMSLEMGAEFPGPAEDVLLAWTLRLGVDADVPAAARKLLADYGVEAMAVGNDQHGRLIALLKETAEGRKIQARRRGGASGRKRYQ
ncbi:hypothetical protein [Limibacillus halophilus]|jgi:hypothetical protein